MYDVTAVTNEFGYVALVADASEEDATAVAANASTYANYSAVFVKVAATGRIAATYVNGKRS